MSENRRERERQPLLDDFRHLAAYLFKRDPRMRSAALLFSQVHEVEPHFVWSRNETPALPHRCSGRQDSCNEIEGIRSLHPDFWDWYPAHAFLAYCGGCSYQAYALARPKPPVVATGFERALERIGLRRQRYVEVDLEVVAQRVRPWFDPEAALRELAPVAAELQPFFDAVYAAPADKAAKRVLAQKLTEVGDPRGAYIESQLGAEQLDYPHRSPPSCSRMVEWLGPLSLVADPQSAAFADGFPYALSVCFAAEAVVRACANDPAWATVGQLDFLDPRDDASRAGVVVEEYQPITPAMASLDMLTGVRSAGLRSLKGLEQPLEVWSVGCDLVDEQDLSMLLSITCLPELNALTIGATWSMLLAPGCWERFWTEHPWRPGLGWATFFAKDWGVVGFEARGSGYHVGVSLGFGGQAPEGSNLIEPLREVLTRSTSIQTLVLELRPKQHLLNEDMDAIARLLQQTHPAAQLEVRRDRR